MFIPDNGRCSFGSSAFNLFAGIIWDFVHLSEKIYQLFKLIQIALASSPVLREDSNDRASSSSSGTGLNNLSSFVFPYPFLFLPLSLWVHGERVHNCNCNVWWWLGWYLSGVYLRCLDVWFVHTTTLEPTTIIANIKKQKKRLTALVIRRLYAIVANYN